VPVGKPNAPVERPTAPTVPTVPLPNAPTFRPTCEPTFKAPTAFPTKKPTKAPTLIPTYAAGLPTPLPTVTPTHAPVPPTFVPTRGPTPSPTPSPTALPGVPTAAPTVPKTNVVVQQTLAGVDFADYQANQQAYTDTLTDTYSQLLAVPPSAIKGLTVTATTSRRMRKLLAAGIAVTFTVVTNLPTVSQAAVTNVLTGAATSGALASTIQTSANTHGAGNLAR
jgi:hypothetical protein